MCGSEMWGSRGHSLSICSVCSAMPNGYLTTTQISACQSEDETKPDHSLVLHAGTFLPFSKAEIGEKELGRG